MPLLKAILWTWAANTVALFVATAIIGGVKADRLWTIVVAGAVFTAVNLLVRPIVRLLALPLIVITFGLILFFINMLMLALTSWIVKPFTINSFGALVAATVVVWAVNAGITLITVMGERRAGREHGAHA